MFKDVRVICDDIFGSKYPFITFAVVVPSFLSFILPSILIKNYVADGMKFSFHNISEKEFYPHWGYFLAIFCISIYMSIFLFVRSYMTRFRIISKFSCLVYLLIELFIAIIVAKIVTDTSIDNKGGIYIIGRDTFRIPLSIFVLSGSGLSLFDIFSRLHDVFTFSAAFSATICVNNMAIASAFPGRQTSEKGVLSIKKRLFKESFYMSIAVWCVGIALLAVWIRLPYPFISTSDKAYFSNIASTITIFYSINYTFIIVTSVSISAYFTRGGWNLPPMKSDDEMPLFSNKMFIYFAMPTITGFSANILSSIAVN